MDEKRIVTLASDSLSGLFGRRHRPSDAGTEYVETIGPVGGNHYLVRTPGDDGMSARLVTINELSGFRFFRSEVDMRSLPDPK